MKKSQAATLLAQQAPALTAEAGHTVALILLVHAREADLSTGVS